jgi:hypothetical protein
MNFARPKSFIPHVLILLVILPGWTDKDNPAGISIAEKLVAARQGKKDCSKIAFISNRDGDLDIYIMKMLDNRIIQLTKNKGILFRIIPHYFNKRVYDCIFHCGPSIPKALLYLYIKKRSRFSKDIPLSCLG